MRIPRFLENRRHRHLVDYVAGVNSGVSAVALFKRQKDGSTRVSLRSKGDVDVRGVSGIWGGGGHKK